jgi:serine phosphatase RsbU (regulator of sigma subunit)
MQQALEIQQSLLPSEKPEFPGFDISAISIAAELVGGDFLRLLATRQ